MIKTYRYNRLQNNAYHVLVGKSGNTVRYNFANGNVLHRRYPELTLRNKYAQDLLEESDIFKNGLVSLTQTVKEASDEEEVKTAGEKSAKEKKPTGDIVGTVTTPDELLAYVNENYGKQYTQPAKALAFAAGRGITFPNLELS